MPCSYEPNLSEIWIISFNYAILQFRFQLAFVVLSGKDREGQHNGNNRANCGQDLGNLWVGNICFLQQACKFQRNRQVCGPSIVANCVGVVQT